MKQAIKYCIDCVHCIEIKDNTIKCEKIKGIMIKKTAVPCVNKKIKPLEFEVIE